MKVYKGFEIYRQGSGYIGRKYDEDVALGGKTIGELRLKIDYYLEHIEEDPYLLNYS